MRNNGQSAREAHEGQAFEVLEKLRRGPIYLNEYRDRHTDQRIEPAIDVLRNRFGYEIEGRGYPYVLLSDEPVLIRVTKAMQDCYYETEWWKKISFERKKYDEFECCHCHGGSGELEVHHLRYRLFDEDLHDDLMTLCQKHHRLMHASPLMKKRCFPKAVPRDVARRLGWEPPHGGSAFRCKQCGQLFLQPVWHCDGCSHHWPFERETCHNCYRTRPKDSP